MSSVLLLISSVSAGPQMRRAEDILIGNDLIVEKVDGVLEENKQLRDKLFEISKQKGKYPQIFVKKDSDNYEFVGLFDDLESISESSTIPADILAANPSIRTINSVFGECKKK